MRTPLTPECTVARNGELPTTRVDADLVVLNLATNNYVGLDEIGRKIWERLEAPRQIGDLCRELATDYAGDPEVIGRDVIAFLTELVDEGLVRVTKG